MVRAAAVLAGILMTGTNESPESQPAHALVLELFANSIEGVGTGADEAKRLARSRQAVRLRERLTEVGRRSMEIVLPERVLVEAFARNLLALADLSRSTERTPGQPTKTYLKDASLLIEAHSRATGGRSDVLTDIQSRIGENPSSLR